LFDKASNIGAPSSAYNFKIMSDLLGGAMKSSSRVIKDTIDPNIMTIETESSARPS
jgi:hypothetical protein